MLSVLLLGGFSVKHDGAPVADVDPPRLQSLLAYLILHRDAPQPRAHLAFLFWPDTSEAQARTNLRNLLHHLRHTLPEAQSYLDISGQTLQWRCEAPFTLDVTAFESSLSHAERAIKLSDSISARMALEQAAALYKGDLLPGCYEEWVLPQRERLRQAYLSTLEKLIAIQEDQRDYPAAIHSAQLLLRHDPLHEATYRLLIRLHALNGDRASGLRVYHTCTTILRRELDVEPGAATREAYQQLLGSEAQPPSTIPATTLFSPLIGREREWAQMLRTWRSVTAGEAPQVLMLRGEAGIGKTRLLEELQQWTVRQGISSASARCYAAEGELAYAPVTAWLRAHPLPPLEDIWLGEVARLRPEVLIQRPDLPRPTALTEAWQRERLFEALSHAILGTSQPLLLIIDDLQWCDRDTLEWLHFLMRFDRSARLLVVGAYRLEEVGESHPLVAALQALSLEGCISEIELQPLDQAATRMLASQVAKKELSAETAQSLYRETEGNPLFVVEMVRAGLPVQVPELDAVPAQTRSQNTTQNSPGLPPRVQSVLGSRLTQLTTPARELAGVAATIGREFSFTLLASVSGCDEDALVRQLDELWQRRIVREHGVDGYDFSHDKLREAAYTSLSAARRRYLHRLTAQALENLHSADLAPVSHQLATHYERAGLPHLAAPHFLRAARVAHQVYANDEAICLIRRGLELIEDVKTNIGKVESASETVAQLWEELGDIFEQRAQHEQALLTYQNAQSRISNSDQIWQARLYRKKAAVLREQRHYAQALDACHQAEYALGSQPDRADDLWWVEWLEVQIEQVWAHYWLAKWPEMDTLLNKLQPIVQEHGKGGNRMRFLMASCLLHLRRERYTVSDEMLTNSREALAASQEWGNLQNRIDCQFELGFLHLWRHELKDAEEHLMAALERAKICEVVPMQVLCLTYLTVLNRFRGQVETTNEYLQRAQAAAESAHMPDYVAAARGNQAWLAWRAGNMSETERMGQEALVIWHQSPLVYPFQWMALWPLIGTALAQGHEDDAWTFVRGLLKGDQQRLPAEISDPLEQAVQTRASGHASARSYLDRALETARLLGYL